MPPGRTPSSPADSFEELQASVLLCPRCRVARPVRERLLLLLPDGELHDYLCSACGTSAGTRKVTAPPPMLVPG
jgi:rubredoxin